MLDILKWLWNNVSTIKDILWIVFTFIATVITILTYRRARYTILQPLRTEVIKRQTDLFIEIMSVFSDESKLLIDLDLDRIVTLNTYEVLDEFGYVLNGAETLRKECEKYFVGGLIVKKGNQLESVKRPEAFGEPKGDNWNERNDFREKIYNELKEGKIDIEVIHITEKYSKTMEVYKKLANNTFLPKEIKVLLDRIIANIYSDISINLKQTLEEIVLRVYNKSKNGEKISINPVGVYNEFNRKRHSNSQLIAEIREKTRAYLMIDKTW